MRVTVGSTRGDEAMGSTWSYLDITALGLGKSLSQDRKRQAKHEAKPGQGDRGDRKR